MKVISPSVTISMKGRDIMNWIKRYMNNLDFNQGESKQDKTLNVLNKKTCMQRIFYILSAGVNSYDII